MVKALSLSTFPLGGCCIHSQNKILSGLIACIFHGLKDMPDCIFIGLKIGSKASLITDSRCFSFFFQQLLQRMEYFRALAQSLGEACGSNRHDHEFLCINRI